MRDWWPSSHGTGWVAATAALFVVLYAANEALVGWLQASVVSGHLDVIFLPAFVRVAAVVVAGAAGLLGLFIASLLITVFYLQDPPVQAILQALASTLGIWAAYAVSVWAIKPQAKTAELPLSLPVLLVMSVLYCIFNALIHAIAWSISGAIDRLSVVHLAQMMLGDLVGVIVMFFITRWAMKLIRVMRPVAT